MIPRGSAFETMQANTVSIPPYWDSPLLFVTALNNGVTLLFLVRYRSMYIYMKQQQDFEGRYCHVLSACALLKWTIVKNEKESQRECFETVVLRLLLQ